MVYYMYVHMYKYTYTHARTHTYAHMLGWRVRRAQCMSLS